MRKNEFRYNVSPKVKRADGKGHISYVTAKKGHSYKYNVITHSDTFFNEPTYKMDKNPQLDSKDKRPSRYSAPRWEKDKYLQEKPKGIWKISKKDKTAIKKFNKNYDKKT